MTMLAVIHYMRVHQAAKGAQEERSEKELQMKPSFYGEELKGEEIIPARKCV
jgi:hypothetical protein